MVNVFRDFSSRHFLCSDDIDIKSEMFLFDRTTADHPIKLTETVPAYMNYSELHYNNKKGGNIIYTTETGAEYELHVHFIMTIKREAVDDSIQLT